MNNFLDNIEIIIKQQTKNPSYFKILIQNWKQRCRFINKIQLELD